MGTPRLITRATDGKIVWRWDNSDPFGLIKPDQNPSGAGTFTFNLRMPGHYFDYDANLFYNYFRDYDPQTGRYVQSDPIGLEGGINTYGYVMGNPLAALDALGLEGYFPGGNSRVTNPSPAKSKDDSCPDDKCKHTITIESSQGVCDPYDSTCAMGLQAAGFAGPYYKTKVVSTYSWPCLVSLGLIGKVGGVKAGNYVAGKAAGWAEGAAVSESAALRGTGIVVGRAAAVYANPITTAAAAPFAIKGLLEHCKCEKASK